MLRGREAALLRRDDCNGLRRGEASSYSSLKRLACTPSPAGEAMQPGKE